MTILRASATIAGSAIVCCAPSAQRSVIAWVHTCQVRTGRCFHMGSILASIQLRSALVWAAQGLVAGVVIGVVIGLVIVLAVTWYEIRMVEIHSRETPPPIALR